MITGLWLIVQKRPNWGIQRLVHGSLARFSSGAGTQANLIKPRCAAAVAPAGLGRNPARRSAVGQLSSEGNKGGLLELGDCLRGAWKWSLLEVLAFNWFAIDDWGSTGRPFFFGLTFVAEEKRSAVGVEGGKERGPSLIELVKSSNPS